MTVTTMGWALIVFIIIFLTIGIGMVAFFNVIC